MTPTYFSRLLPFDLPAFGYKIPHLEMLEGR